MRKDIYTIIIVLFIGAGNLYAQVALNPNGDPPDPSAMLDVNSNNKGVLIPRMTLAEMNAIENPAEGLMIYCTDCNVHGGLVTRHEESWSIMDRSVTKNGLIELPLLNQNYGGSSVEKAKDISLTSDLGYFMVGATYSNDGDIGGNPNYYDYWVVKLNKNGYIIWETNLASGSDDFGQSGQQTDDGGYIVLGYSYTFSGNSNNYGKNDYWAVKLSDIGAVEWEKNFGGSDHDYGESILQTTDGGYILAGHTESNDIDVTGNNGGYDYFIIKLFESGSIEWNTTLGGSDWDKATDIKQTSDGGYIVTGYSGSSDGDVGGNNGNFDYWVVKLSSTGILEWEKNLGGSGLEWANSIQQTSDNGYITAGYSGSSDGDVGGNNGSFDYWIVKLTSSGAIEWEKNYGGTNSEEAYSIIQTLDGGYLIAGSSNSNDGDIGGNQGMKDYWIVKVSSTGVMEWEKNLGGSNDDVAYSVKQVADGGYIIMGDSGSSDGDVSATYGNNDFWVVKLDADGNIQ
ncbi:MAG: hypothetical protein R2764_22440 [Bacteroidales bacterium]